MGLKLSSLFLLLVAAMAGAEAKALPGCLEKCGAVEIPYPFGVGSSEHRIGLTCFLEERFNLTCNHSTSTLFFGNLPVSNISLQGGQMDVSMLVAKTCYNQSGGVVGNESAYNLHTSAFTISSTQNMFVSIGPNTLGIIAGYENNQTSYGLCLALSAAPPKYNNCSGNGCCHVEIPVDGLRNLSYEASSALSKSRVLPVGNFCSYAFVAKKSWFNFSPAYVHNFPDERTPLVLDWTVSNATCQNASSSCACKNNTQLVNSIHGYGYNCNCKAGFEGNPYHPDGCHDVDECSRPDSCNITTLCHNFDGGYNCSCPPGYKGDGYVNGTGCTLDTPQSHHILLILIIALSGSVTLLVVFTLVSTSCWAYKHRTLKQLRRRNFEQNGGNILQQLSQQQRYGEKSKIFTEVELKNATNSFDESRILGRGGQGTVYKGILPDDTPIAIKKPRVVGDPRQIKDFINEVSVLSQINHRNVVKLLGCCLETEVPLLVYEFVDNGTLLDHIDPSKNAYFITWETRLRIAAETAEAISYLHSSASIPIIHRDIKSANILLDHNLRAKVSDFGASKLIPLDETHVTTVVQGTLGYLDPEYLHVGQLNEKSDVYSFGVVLVELLTGKKAIEFKRLEQRNLAMYFVSSMKENMLSEILDMQMLNQENEKQMNEVAILARRCLGVSGEGRPTMKEVATELEGLIAMKKHPCKEDEDSMVEESEYLLGHIPDGHEDASTSISIGYDSIQKQAAIEITDGR